LLDETPEDLPRRNPEVVIPGVVSADVHQPNEAALPAARNRKYVCKQVKSSGRNPNRLHRKALRVIGKKAAGKRRDGQRDGR
jgi:hypothetical protein